MKGEVTNNASLEAHDSCITGVARPKQRDHITPYTQNTTGEEETQKHTMCFPTLYQKKKSGDPMSATGIHKSTCIPNNCPLE